jgi:spore germination cell wall hydrolase CwlJ-like protein
MSGVEKDVEVLKQEVREVKKEVALIKTAQHVKLTAAEQDCLAKNIFHEAGVEPYAGKIAVAQVTHNRLKSGKWGKDLCKVVYAKAQFSWTLQKKKRAAKPKGQLWAASVKAAKEFAQGTRVTHVDNSQFYHTDYIATPKWADPDKELIRVGQHIFYSNAKNG